MASWGEYQSVIQLSVGLNTAYAALASYLGRDLQTEQQALRELDEAVPVERREINSKTLTDLQLLSGDLVGVSIRYEDAINGLVRPSCLAFGLVGVLLLVYSSIVYSEIISGIWQTICCLLLLPFLVGCIYAVFITFPIRTKFATQRKTIEESLFGTATFTK